MWLTSQAGETVRICRHSASQKLPGPAAPPGPRSATRRTQSRSSGRRAAGPSKPARHRQAGASRLAPRRAVAAPGRRGAAGPCSGGGRGAAHGGCRGRTGLPADRGGRAADQLAPGGVDGAARAVPEGGGRARAAGARWAPLHAQAVRARVSSPAGGARPREAKLLRALAARRAAPRPAPPATRRVAQGRAGPKPTLPGAGPAAALRGQHHRGLPRRAHGHVV
jgi:hypothetical protein